MTLWRYSAIELSPHNDGEGTRTAAHNGSAVRVGELSGDSAAEIRASLRRIGLQAIEVLPLKRKTLRLPIQGAFAGVHHLTERHFRSRRRAQSAEIFDSMATMLSAGIPLLEAVDALAASSRGGGRSARLMLVQIREELRTGHSLGHAMRQHRSWFDVAEVAMVEAGQHSGNLPEVLTSLAQRHEHAGELTNKFVSALTYPFIVLLVGIGVAIFLSVKTLPDLVKILEGAKVPVPMLTARVMWTGQFIAGHWFLLLVALFALITAATAVPAALRRMDWEPIRFERLRGRLRPRVMRTMAVGGLAIRLAELVRSGVPMVDALRILAPTTGYASLRKELLAAADAVEHGDELSDALDDEHWFDPEFQRLLDVGQNSGELDQMLHRIGQRYQRQARRLIDRLAALLEPTVILLLAIFVGTVVMAAVLPLLRLQEVI